MSHNIGVGDVLGSDEWDSDKGPGGFCGGVFGRDSYDVKRVEAIGKDWIVARPIDGGPPTFAGGKRALEILADYVNPEYDE